MAKNNIEELKKKDSEELTKLLVEKNEALRVFRFDTAGSKIRNTMEGRKIRKEIARIKTLLNATK